MASRAKPPTSTIKRFGQKELPKAPEPEKPEPPTFTGSLQDITLNQGQKIEYTLKVDGSKPLTVTWTRNATKLKSGKNSKITFTKGEAKLLIIQAEAEDDGEYKVEASNEHGTVSLTASVHVVQNVPEKLTGKNKQKERSSVDQDSLELRRVSLVKRDSVAARPSVEINEIDKTALKRSPRESRGSLAKPSTDTPVIPSIVVDGGGDTPNNSRRGSAVVDPDKLKIRRTSTKPPKEDTEDDEATIYFKTKPQNQVVVIGDNMKVDCTFKLKPPAVDWYRGAIPVKTDPRVTIIYDEILLYSSMEMKKCKLTDEAKFRVQVEDDAGEECLEFAGFSLFVKDPKDSGLDFRSILKHKDHKKRRGTKDDPDWGELSHLEKEKPDYSRNRRMSTIDLSRGNLQSNVKERKEDSWIDPLEDLTCQEKEAKVELACKFSKPNARVRWYKNKLEIFQGPKYNISDENGIFRLVINRAAMEDAAKYTCSANLKETSCQLTVEGKKIVYNFTQKLPPTERVKRKKDLVLECALNDQSGQVNWTKNGEKIEYTPGKYEISRRGDKCILKIKNADKDDAAEFACEVDGDKTICKVNIDEPDYDFDKTLQDADAYEKETAEFECEVNDEEAPVQWYQGDKKIDINDPKYFCVQDGKKRRLRVNHVTPKDEGIYKCKTKDKETSAKLFVAPDVVIKEQLKGERKYEGEEVQMQCRVNNPKKYPVKWFKDGKEIKEGDMYTIKEDEEGRQTLIIKDLKLDDAGEFTCKIGDRETSAKLQVDEASRPPNVNLDAIPREITVKAGKRVALEIPYTAQPVPTTKWSKNGQPLGDKTDGTKDDNISMSQAPDMCKLNLSKARRSDTGEYEIEFKNQSGQLTVPITIKVIDKPSKPEGPLKLCEVYRDRCRLAWKPPLDDGGLPILRYIVEAQDMDSEKWFRVGKVMGDTQCGVPGLEPGKKYKFRVKAVNSEGESEPLTLEEEVLAKDPFDPPGKPGKPEVLDYDKDRVEIKWTPPENDGGNPISKYVIEKREKGGCWQKVGMVPPEDTQAIIPGLDEGKEYDFRVTPVNDGGPGKASDPSDPVFTKARKVKPRIDRESFSDNIMMKQGQELNIDVRFFGEPSPRAKWTKGEKLISASGDVQILNSTNNPIVSAADNVKLVTKQEYSTNLVYPKLKRKDTGKYTIMVSNQHGFDEADINLVVLSAPGSPKGPLEITDVQKDSTTIKWSKPDDDGGKPITGYTIEKMNAKTGKWDPIVLSVPADQTEFKVPRLKEGEEYKFRVKAENTLGTSEPLDSEHATKIKNPHDPSDPPGKPEVVDSGKNFIKLKWEKPKKDGGTSITGYNIEKKDPRTGSWNKINDEPLATPEFTDTKVQPNKEYQYRVTAENDAGESKPSEASEPIKARPLKDAPKVDLGAFAGKEIRVRAGEQIKIEVPVSGSPSPLVSWSKNGKPVLPSERLKQMVAEDPIRGDDKATLFIPSAVRGDTGKFTIAAKNENGESSGDINVIVLDRPSPPKDIEAKEVFCDHATLTWKPPADDGGGDITGYLLEKCVDDSGIWEPMNDIISGTIHTVKGLKPGKKYKFRTRAENVYGLSDPVEMPTSFVAKNPFDKPSAPGKPTVKESDKDHITLKWDPPKKDGGAPILGYNFERFDPRTGKWNKVNGEPIKSPEFSDKRVQPNKEYEYRVTAINNGGESDPSETSGLVKAKPLKAPPKVDLSSLGGREIRVKAGDPIDFDFPIDGTPTPTVIWTKDGKDLPPSDRVLQSNTEEKGRLNVPIARRDDTGKYTVMVKNENGEDTGTVNIIVLDKPGAPGFVTPSGIFADHCRLSWSEPDDNGGSEITGYIVEKCIEGTNNWEKVPGIPSGTTHMVRDLEPGKKYKFRVRAENIYGLSEPTETDRAILAKNPFDAPSEPKDLAISKKEKSTDCDSALIPLHCVHG